MNSPSSSDSEDDKAYFDVDVVFTRKNNISPIKMRFVVVQVRKVNRLIRVGLDVSNIEATINFIDTRKWSLSTKNGYLQALASVFSVFPDFQAQHRYYSDEFTKRLQIITEEPLLKKEQAWPKWSEIDQLYIMGTSILDRALLGFNTCLPPRRVTDIASLKFGKVEGGNYITSDYSTVVYSVYKTVKTHGVVAIAIPEKLKVLLEELELKEGDGVWPLSANPSRRLSNAFATVTNQHITSNILRNSFLSYALSQPQTVEFKKHLAKLMGHSLSTQQSHIKLDPTIDSAKKIDLPAVSSVPTEVSDD